MFHVTGTIEGMIKKITEFDLKMKRVYSQNIPEMIEYFESIRNRVSKIEEDKNGKDEEVIDRFKSKLQTSAL